MATSSISYLQTLSSSEMDTFVDSLLKVKQHLNHEIAWFSEQLQQKTVQLQGIESLLADSGVESVPPENVSTPALATVSAVAEISAPSLNVAHSSEPAAPIAPLSIRQKPGRKPGSKTAAKPVAKPTPKTKEPIQRKAQSSTSSPIRTEGPELRQFLQPQFRDTSLSEAILQVLKKASEPLSPDNIASELYEGLSSEDYGRAKRSLVSVLSLGRSKGKWQSPGRGLYERVAATA